MVNFKKLCKRIFLGKKAVHTDGSTKKDDQQFANTNQPHHLIKKVKESFKAKRSSNSPVQGLPEIEQTQHRLVGVNNPATTSSVASPATHQNASYQSPIAQQSSGGSSTWIDCPPERNITSPSSTQPSPEQSPPTIVCELPASYSFEDAPADDVKENSGSKNVARQGEAKHWGGIASSINRQQLEDPCYQLTLGTPAQRSVGRRDISPPAVTTKVTVVEAFGIFERSVQEEALYHTHTPSSQQGSPSANKGKIGTAENEDSGVGDVDISGDKGSIKSETPGPWKRALESQEQSFQNEIEDIREDHAAEVEELQEKITELQAEAKAVHGRKAYIEKAAKKIAEKKATEITRQKILLDAANADISSKDEALGEQAKKIEYLEKLSANTSSQYAELQATLAHTRQWEIIPLQQEVRRLMSLGVEQEQRIKAQATQMLLLYAQSQAQPNVAELQTKLTDAQAQSNTYKAQFQHLQNLYHQTIEELVKAKDQLNTQHIRLSEYRAEHEDHPACGATTDGLIKQKDEQYQLLEKKANETFMLWKKGKESHDHEKIMLGATIEELKATIDNLEGNINLATNESARLMNVTEDYIEMTQTKPENPDVILRELYELSKKTIRELKEKLHNQGTQLANTEKALYQQRGEVQIRDLLLQKKETELSTLESEKIDAERAIENFESKLEFREADFKNELANKDEDLQLANEKIGELQFDIRAIAQSEEASASSNEARHQLEISRLHQFIQEMQDAEHQRVIEKHRRDFHETSCASSNALTWKIHAQNWENAQLEIQGLKKHIKLIEQGCDPEKFDIAQKYEELKEEKDTLEQMLCEQMESMTQTMEEHTAAANAKSRKTQAEIRFLGEIAGNLCRYLKDAWSVKKNKEDLSAEELEAAHVRLASLKEVRDGVYQMMSGLSEEDDEADVEGQPGDFTTDDNSEPNLEGGEDDVVEQPVNDTILNIPASQISDPWPYITGTHNAEPPIDNITEALRQVPGSYPLSTASLSRPGRTYTADYSTDSDDWYTAGSSQNACGTPITDQEPLQPSANQENAAETMEEDRIEAELISPAALLLQQSTLPSHRGWTVTTTPTKEWNHEYFSAEELEQAWADTHNPNTNYYGYDGAFDDQTVPAEEEDPDPTTIPASQDFEIWSDGANDGSAAGSNGEEDTIPSNVLSTRPAPAKQFDPNARLPEHHIRFGRGLYITYGDYAEYWKSIEAELMVGDDDGIDHWELALTDIPGYDVESQGVYWMSGALPAEEEEEEEEEEEDGLTEKNDGMEEVGAAYLMSGALPMGSGGEEGEGEEAGGMDVVDEEDEYESEVEIIV
ncbi:MAG: hypothetical protein LQ343_000112 [Gyalolechia ehrenbergii]|nr:MAG: hypothetical protein LQ343_000112 [Gyalolechia ehrenbergii]